MLKSFNATLAANTAATLLTASSGHEILAVGLRINGGQNGGTVTLTKNNGSSDVFSETYTVGVGDVLSLDCKTAFPAGYSWTALSDTAGVQIDVCADDMEV